jgi:hypothetical protein
VLPIKLPEDANELAGLVESKLERQVRDLATEVADVWLNQKSLSSLRKLEIEGASRLIAEKLRKEEPNLEGSWNCLRDWAWVALQNDMLIQRIAGDLEPDVVAKAQAVLGRWAKRQEGREFTEEALSYVFEALARNKRRFDGSPGGFFFWVGKVIRNQRINQYRQKSPGRGGQSAETTLPLPEVASIPIGKQARPQPWRPLELPATDIGVPIELLPARALRQNPDQEFESDVIRQIERWSARERVILLILVRVWKRVPGEIWDAWVREDGREPPFPPEEMMPVGGITRWDDWLPVVAVTLVMSQRALRNFQNRHKHRFKELPQIPWLKPGNELPRAQNRNGRNPE